MTKHWAYVRRDICAMYKRGESLEAIQKRLSQRGFHAHIRSYRSRIAAWGMKRSDVSNVKKRQERPPPLPGEGVGSTGPVNIGTTFPGVQGTVYEDLGYYSSDALEPTGNHHGSTSAGGQRTNDEDRLRMLYGSLSYAIQHNMKADIDWALKSHEVVEGNEWILHFALRAPPAPVDWETTALEEMLCFLKRSNISLDLPDSQGHSPVEIAIFSNKVKELETLLRHDADANRIGNRGLSPLQTALLSSSSADTIRCLLNHGADTQRTFPPMIAGSAPQIAEGNTPLAFVVKKLELGVDRVHWLKIIGVFADHATSTDLGFSMDDGRQQSVLRSFVRDWQHSASPDILFKAVSPFLVALLRRPTRLDPMKPICDNQSLFQLAIFHSPVDSDLRLALARLIIQESDLDLSGTKMLECILRYCPENNLDCEAVVKLVGQLLLRPFSLRPEVIIVQTLLQHIANWPARQRLAILGILTERRRVDCLIESSRPENRWRLLDYVAACGDEASYEFAEYLMQVRAHSSDRLTLFEDVLWNIRNKLFTVNTLADLWRILRFPGEGHQMVAKCVLHVATKLKVQALRVDQPHVRERLRFLLDIRQAYHLPDVQMSGELVRLDLGPSVPLQSVLHTTCLQRSQNAVYGSWF